MRTYDLSPLFRSTVGFDRMTRLLDGKLDDQNGYPPYNIEKLGEESYRITMAVAGFGPDDLDITTQDGALVIKGRLAAPDGERQYLHRGIAGRAFERRFHLADHIRVVDASLANGLLHVNLVRELPEAKKPRTIRITRPEAGDRHAA